MPNEKNIAMTFKDTSTWQNSFRENESECDEFRRAKRRLIDAYDGARERVRVLLNEIRKDVPYLTVHDITHIDALWAYVDIIAGNDYPLTPLECFILGATILLHDAGMSYAAAGGTENIRVQYRETWYATVADVLASRLPHEPTPDEIANPPRDIENEAAGIFLREQHTVIAEHLVTREWRWDDRDFRIFEDIDLAKALGSDIGRLAASHGNDLALVLRDYGTQTKEPPNQLRLPAEWAYCPLKIACLLRCADAAHFTRERAPSFAAALWEPKGNSYLHFVAQNQITERPHCDTATGALIYESASWPENKMEAWWLAFDTLSMINRELQEVNRMISVRRPSFPQLKARYVADVASPLEFAQSFRPQGWEPVDARVRISNPHQIVRDLGGAQLYGNDLTVPIRELLQNAIDAVIARRALDDSFIDGCVVISLHTTSDGHWELTIADNGIGMTPDIMINYLLDFGTSFWRSSEARRRYPNIAGKGTYLTGRFGIGFYSVFMLGQRVRITSRAYTESASQARQLSFGGGIATRPIMRRVTASEDKNTTVEVEISPEVIAKLCERDPTNSVEVESAAERLFRSLLLASPVTVQFERSSGKQDLCAGEDWQKIGGIELMKRVGDERLSEIKDLSWSSELPQLVTCRNSGRVVGRLGLYPFHGMYASSVFIVQSPGAIVVGPFPAQRLTEFCGVVEGRTNVASRNSASVDVSQLSWDTWLETQSDILTKYMPTRFKLAHIRMAAGLILNLGGRPRRLQIFETRGKPYSLVELSRWLTKHSRFRVELHGWSSSDEKARTKKGTGPLLYACVDRRLDEVTEKCFCNLKPVHPVTDLLGEECERLWGKGCCLIEDAGTGAWLVQKRSASWL